MCYVIISSRLGFTLAIGLYNGVLLSPETGGEAVEMATLFCVSHRTPIQFYFKDPVRSWVSNHANNKGSTKSENLDVFSRSRWLRNLNETDTYYSCCF